MISKGGRVGRVGVDRVCVQGSSVAIAGLGCHAVSLYLPDADARGCKGDERM